MLYHVCKHVADSVVRRRVPPQHWAYLQMIYRGRRKRASGGVTAVVGPWEAHITREAQVLDEDPPELGLADGEGLDHGHREEGKSNAFTEPLDHPLALFGCAAVVCRQEGPAPQTVSQGARLSSDQGEVLESDQRLGSSCAYFAATLNRRGLLHRRVRRHVPSALIPPASAVLSQLFESGVSVCGVDEVNVGREARLERREVT